MSDFIKGLGLSQIVRCPVSWVTLYVEYDKIVASLGDFVERGEYDEIVSPGLISSPNSLNPPHLLNCPPPHHLLTSSSPGGGEKGDASKEGGEEDLGQLVRRCNKARAELHSLMARCSHLHS